MKNKHILSIAALFVLCSGVSALQAGAIKSTFPVTKTDSSATSTASMGTTTKSITVVQKGSSVSSVIIQDTTTYPDGSTSTSTERYGLSRTSYGGTYSYSSSFGGFTDSGSFSTGGPAMVKLKTKKTRGRVSGGTAIITLLVNSNFSSSSPSGSSSSSSTGSRRIIAKVGKKSSMSYLETETSGTPPRTETESGSGKAKGKIK